MIAEVTPTPEGMRANFRLDNGNPGTIVTIDDSNLRAEIYRLTKDNGVLRERVAELEGRLQLIAGTPRAT